MQIIQFIMKHSWLFASERMMPSDALWLWRSWPILFQVMTWCLTAPSHYQNHCWLTTDKILRINAFRAMVLGINRENIFENYILKMVKDQQINIPGTLFMHQSIFSQRIYWSYHFTCIGSLPYTYHTWYIYDLNYLNKKSRILQKTKWRTKPRLNLLSSSSSAA